MFSFSKKKERIPLVDELMRRKREAIKEQEEAIKKQKEKNLKKKEEQKQAQVDYVLRTLIADPCATAEIENAQAANELEELGFKNEGLFFRNRSDKYYKIRVP